MAAKRAERAHSAPAQQAQQMGSQSMLSNVPLVKRVNHWIEWSGSGILLDVASAVLSLLTVMTYMVETRYTEHDSLWVSLRIVDQVCSVIFAAEWCFWCWLSRNRAAYICSWQSLVDIATIVPIFISLFVSRRVPGFATFEAMVRIFRVVRVFRIFRLGKRLKSEVLSCLLTLVFTLLAIIVTGAGIFYEIESRFGDRYPELTIEEAIYYSVVTVTTIGYGDITPSITASRMTLLAMLLIAFTLLPYQTSMLVNALSETSIYQSAHYSRATRGRHVVLMGHLTAASAGVIVDELFHPDSGFADYSCVLLNPSPPTDAMKRLLKTSRHAHRLLYLQGSWASQQDLARAQVDSCEAVFVLCNKAPADARQEDLQTVMACLAVGQYVQLRERARHRLAPKPLMQRVMDTCRQFVSYFHKANSRKAAGIPRLCLQLLLPESKQHLHHLLSLYSKQGLLATRPPAAATPAAGATAAAAPQQHADWSGAQGGAAECDAAARIVAKAATGKGGMVKNQQQGEGAAQQQALEVAAAAAGGPQWWQSFSRQVMCICVTELRYGLLAHSCMGCSGAITLVSNLIRSVDDGLLTQAEFESLPEWSQEYLEGSSNELYEVAAFPAHLHGKTVADVAQHLLEVFRAVLLAAAGTSTGSRSNSSSGGSTQQTHTKQAAQPAAEATAQASTQPQQLQQQQQQQRHSSSTLQLAALCLNDVITPQTMAVVIASDVRVVLDIVESTAEEYSAWEADRKQKVGEKPLAKHSMAYMQPAIAYSVWKSKAAQHSTAANSSSLRSVGGTQHVEQVCEPQPAALPCSQLTSSSAESTGAGNVAPSQPPHEAVQGDSQQQQPGPATAAEGEAATAAAVLPSSASTASCSAASSRRTTAEQSSFRGVTAPLKSLSTRSLLAALPAGLGSAAAAEGGAHSRQRRQRGAIQVKTRGMATLGDAIDGADADPEDSQAGMQPGPLLLSCVATPSQRRRTALELSMQQLYHTRDWTKTAAECMQAMQQQEVHLAGHLLVCGSGTPAAALACLLKPLRSTAMPGQLQPVVVLDTLQPSGVEWEELARLADVHFVQGSRQETDALLRACADTAATAVVLLPWSQQSDGVSWHDSVAAGMVDAGVVSVVRRLRALNPHVQVFPELDHCQSLRFLDPLGSLLDGCSVDEAAAAAASPSFMSGAVLLPLMDSLMCQAVNNRGTPHILASLLSQWHCQHQHSSRQAHKPQQQQQQQQQHMHDSLAGPHLPHLQQPQQLHSSEEQGAVALQAAGKAPGAGSAGQEAAAQLHVTAVTPLHSTKHGGSLVRELQGLHAHGSRTAVLLQVPLTGFLHCSTFGELFERLLQCHSMLCCALYRQAAIHGSEMSYVYTNPHKDTQLRAFDRAFVLAAVQPGSPLPAVFTAPAACVGA